MIVRLNKTTNADNRLNPIGVEGDHSASGKISEVDKIVGDARRKVHEDGVPGVGVSGSNSGKGHDPKLEDDDSNKRISMERVVEEEPGLVEGDSHELDPAGAEVISPETRSTLKRLPDGAK